MRFDEELSNPQTARILEWLATPAAKPFRDAIGIGGGDEMIALALSKLPSYLGARFPMFKDRIDMARCDTLTDFIHGDSVSQEDMTIAVGLMMQSYGAACDRIYYLERALAEARRPRLTPRPAFHPKVGPPRMR